MIQRNFTEIFSSVIKNQVECKEKVVEVMLWPPQSPDVNIMESV